MTRNVRRAPSWTDANVSDPGITLVQLLAYVGDLLSYYQDKAAEEAYLAKRRAVLGVIGVAAVAYWCCGRRRGA